MQGLISEIVSMNEIEGAIGEGRSKVEVEGLEAAAAATLAAMMVVRRSK